MNKEKPYKGEIHNWKKQKFDKKKYEAEYKEPCGLGYIIWGDAVEHPIWAGASWFHTSWVVKHNKKTGEIETRNSRYRLIGKEHE